MISLLGSQDAAARQPISQRIALRASRALAGRGHDRRRFLRRAAIVGTALVVNPLDFILRPQSAYASVCGNANECSQGWTAMCCTINGGANTCPPGSYVAGWWKISSSAFCNGEDRYVVDCNRTPGASCSCRCADGPCDRRRVCCNNFRYGQCNQQIAGVTQVVCRVIICTPPWEWDPACTTTVRTDNRTATHNASCLNPPNPTLIAITYQDLGLVGSVLGAPLADEELLTDGAWRAYEQGSITAEGNTQIVTQSGPVAIAYRDLGGPTGPLGWPLAELEQEPDGRGIRGTYEGGVILHTPTTGSRLVSGDVLDRYLELDGPAGPLGYPTADPVVFAAPGGAEAVRAPFEHGTIYTSETTGSWELIGATEAAFDERGGAEGFLGLPVSGPEPVPAGRVRSRFSSGWSLVHDPATGEVRLIDAATDLPTSGAWPDQNDVTVWADETRILTAVEVSRRSFEDGARAGVIVAADRFADALGGGALAAARGGPLLLTETDGLQEEVSLEIGRLDLVEVIVAGGEDAISEAVLEDIRRRVPDAMVTRLSGEDRYATAVALASADGVDTVVLASGESFADALAATPLAARIGAPVLLATPTQLPQATADALEELRPGDIVVVGGPAALSEAVERAAGNAGRSDTRRLAGESRFDTAVAISRSSHPDGADVVVLATGERFPDALAAGPAAAALDAPVLLVTEGLVPPIVREELARLSPSQLIVVGGPSAVGELALEQLTATSLTS